jgi:hypothetical protein
LEAGFESVEELVNISELDKAELAVSRKMKRIENAIENLKLCSLWLSL